MYRGLKDLLKKILPLHSIFQYESFFRYFHYLFYIGSAFQCNICDKKLSRFIPASDSNSICPACGSAARNRRLWTILQNGFLKEGISILHFSPARCLYRKLKNVRGLQYTATDYAGEFFADKKLDITNIEENNDSCDLILCYHVLEHVENDRKAINELYRILKPGGICLIQTPFKEGEILEDPSVTSADERLKRFGQKDHVRVYSAAGLKERLIKTGFNVKINEFTEDKDNLYGLKQNEIVIIAKKLRE